MTAYTWLVLALLIAFNGLYVAAEFASVSVRRSRIRKLAEEGDAAARRLLPILEDGRRLDRYIAACQVGITISSLVLGAYGQATLAELLVPLFEGLGGMQVAAAQSTSAVVILVGLTTIQMVFGELVPKSLALQHPTKVALWTTLPMRWSQAALSWFIAILNGSGWAVLRLFGVEPAGHRHVHSPEEIRFLIAESGTGGHLEPEEQARLNHALGLTQRTARELMVPRTRMTSIPRDLPLAEAVARAADAPYTRFPVHDETLDDVVGMVHAKDLALARLSGGDAALPDLLRPILAVHERLSADRVLSLMREERGVMAVVVDDFGGTSGLITAEDILTELLGEVGDEFKHHGAEPRRLSDGRVRLPGDLPLYETPRWLGVGLEGESDTVGGLLAERLGRIPDAGDRVEIEGVELVVERVERHAVRSVLARPVEAPEPDDEASDAAPEESS